METTHYPLVDEQTHANYFANMNPGDYSVTFTMNPQMLSADIVTQYRKALHEITSSHIFMTRNHREKIWIPDPDFDFMYIVPELTADFNIHFHGYFRCNPESGHIFVDRFKKLCYNNPVLGRQMKVSYIDELEKVITHQIPLPRKPLTQDDLEAYIWRGTISEYALKEIRQRTSKCNGSNKLYITKFKNNIDFQYIHGLPTSQSKDENPRKESRRS